MGIWRFAGAFAVVERQSECGSKTAGMHVSQPMTHRRVLGGRYLLLYSLLNLIDFFFLFLAELMINVSLITYPYIPLLQPDNDYGNLQHSLHPKTKFHFL